jgi:hypothetical protein
MKKKMKTQVKHVNLVQLKFKTSKLMLRTTLVIDVYNDVLDFIENYDREQFLLIYFFM